jgi:hypothetical protein
LGNLKGVNSLVRNGSSMNSLVHLELFCWIIRGEIVKEKFERGLECKLILDFFSSSYKVGKSF